MKIRVLGSAAGGGFPQWNCNCDNCRGQRNGSLNVDSRTQSSIAVSADGVDWVLFNASPDVRQQIIDFPALQPDRARRDTGIASIILMDSQIDHTSGLLFLRESHHPLRIYCSDMVFEDLSSGFPVFKMLEHYCGVDRTAIPIDGQPFKVTGGGELEFRGYNLSSKAPPYSPHRNDPHPGDNIGISVRDPASGKQVFYAPGLGAVEDHLRPVMSESDCLLVDGTFWTEDEMIRREVGKKMAADMGHMAQSGDNGMLSTLSAFDAERKILIHINNTNPMLVNDSSQRAEVEGAGIEIAYDGMEISL